MEENNKLAIKHAYSEVLYIINNLKPNLYRKIPNKFIRFLYSNMDYNYTVDIDLKKNINEQNLLPETRALLAIIYRDFICSKERKKELIEEDYNYFKEENKRINNVFNNRLPKDVNAQVNEEKKLIIVKDNIFTKIKRIIKIILGKKHS